MPKATVHASLAASQLVYTFVGSLCPQTAIWQHLYGYDV